jgi:hypothetical protein
MSQFFCGHTFVPQQLVFISMEKEFIYLFIQLMEWGRRSLMWGWGEGPCYYSYMWMCHVFCVEYLFLNFVGNQLKDIGWLDFKTFVLEALEVWFLGIYIYIYLFIIIFN